MNYYSKCCACTQTCRHDVEKTGHVYCENHKKDITRDNQPQDVLGGTNICTEKNRYLARNGLWYNGYVCSSDFAEDMCGEVLKKIVNKIKNEL